MRQKIVVICCLLVGSPAYGNELQCLDDWYQLAQSIVNRGLATLNGTDDSAFYVYREGSITLEGCQVLSEQSLLVSKNSCLLETAYNLAQQQVNHVTQRYEECKIQNPHNWGVACDIYLPQRIAAINTVFVISSPGTWVLQCQEGRAQP